MKFQIYCGAVVQKVSDKMLQGVSERWEWTSVIKCNRVLGYTCDKALRAILWFGGILKHDAKCNLEKVQNEL